MRYALPLTILVLSGCSLFDSGGLEVNADPPTLVLDNTSGQTIFYLAIENNEAAAMDIDFSNVTRWPRVPAGETLRLPYERIAGYDEGDDDVWVWWSFAEGGGSQHRVTL
ncbi:MAG: hypothetical protein AAF845_04765 [Bacteroidota bacterium]